MYRTWIDIPGGADYGFPRKLPDNYYTLDLHSWLKSFGYKEDTNKALEQAIYTIRDSSGSSLDGTK